MKKIKKIFPDSRSQILLCGMSLVEILVVISIFAILGMIVTSSIVLTLQGTKKSESVIRTKENLNYSLSILERNIRNANSISECLGTTTNTISYLDQNGKPSSFSCVNVGSTDSYIASGSARLTTDAIKITSCSFVCTASDSTKPPFITIDITAKDALSTGAQSAEITASTQIYLRNY